MQLNTFRYFERIRRKVSGYIPAQAKILDVGCGEGYDADLLHRAGGRVTGIDIEEQKAAWQVRSKPGLCFQTGSAEALPFPDAAFDVVWAKDALHHMEAPEQAVREMWRVTAPGGVMLLIEANRYNPVFYVHMTLMEKHEHFTRRRFKQLVEHAGAAYDYFMLESRCLPWSGLWIQNLQEWGQEILEHIPGLKPWLTYQVAAVRKPAAQ